MAIITFHDRDGTPLLARASGDEAAAALWAQGIASGRWVLRAQPVSKTPQLTYARELQALQTRFDSVLTDRVRQRAGSHPGDPRDHHRVAWPDQREEHVHAEPEVRVVLEGAARYVLRIPAAGGWAVLLCHAGDWLALPAGLAHTFEASPTQGIELLRLFARHGGWLAERTAAKVPSAMVGWESAVVDLPLAA